MVSARVRREQVAYVERRGLSRRRACALLSVARSTLGYQSRLAVKDAPVLAAMHELAAQYPRYGYRRIQVFLERQGHGLSTDRVYRLWRQARLQVPRRRPRRRVATHRPRPLPATGANHLWAYDFVFDACANGQQLKCLTVVDEYTRECLAIDVAGSIRSGRVIDVLSRLITIHGAPRYLRSDNVLRTEASPSCGNAHPVRAPWRARNLSAVPERPLSSDLPRSSRAPLTIANTRSAAHGSLHRT
jgi:putative transposase